MSSQLIQLLYDGQSTSYAAVAALTVLVFDHILCFGEEVELMWKSRWNLAKGIYLWNRYFCLAALIVDVYFDTHPTPETTQACQAFLQVQGAVATVIVGTVDAVLVIRVWVLYERSKKLLFFLIPLLLCEIIPMAFISVFSDLPLKEFVHAGPYLNGCYSTEVPKYLTFYTVPALAISTIMFMMTLFKCGFVAFSTKSSAAMPFIKLFARDGLWWFIAVLLITSTDIIIWAVGRPTLAEVNIAISCSLYSIIASRVLLNLKAAFERGGVLSTAFATNTGSGTLVFDRPSRYPTETTGTVTTGPSTTIGRTLDEY